MNDTTSQHTEADGSRNRYAHRVTPTIEFRRLWNRATNDNCGEETLRAMIEDALIRGQIKPYEHSRLTEKLAVRFGTAEATQKEKEPEFVNKPNGDGRRTPRSRKDHHGVSTVLRPRVMVSKPVPNIRDTGPPNAIDFRPGRPVPRLVPVDPHLGSAFGSRVSFRSR